MVKIYSDKNLLVIFLKDKEQKKDCLWTIAKGILRNLNLPKP